MHVKNLQGAKLAPYRDMACLENYIKICLQVTWPYVETVWGSPSLQL